ncbi:Abi-like protein [Schinkia azotoformans MEV2011]|uniref:Abi-like protein n=1 Tax=Schinkia azotoformans MEV2011 TaxID=1348973 RepID=A0A072NQC7_SCHAZ|nr:Abi-like protein [Schinkia azotoformans MEV2011]
MGHFISPRGWLKLNPDKDQFQVKPPKTYKEQVEIYKNRNLQIEDPEKAEEVLKRINYYRLSGYGLTLKDPIYKNQYKEGLSFEKMLSLYEFDRKLRSLLLQKLEIIEIMFRTHFSYEIAHKCGPLGHRDKENFSVEEYHKESMEELDKLVQKSRKGELFIQHHFSKYGGQIPIWAVIEITSFGFLSKLYKNLALALRKHIASTYYGVPHIYIESWMQSF